MNQAGIDLLKSFEGCRLRAYRDSVMVWTIGYGHTSMAGPPEVKSGLTITQAEAEGILKRDLVKYETAVNRAISRVPTENQFAAMVSLCYNIGPGNFNRSTVLSAFNAGNLGLAADAFRRWNKAGGKVLKGLVRRREAERALFMKP